MKCTNCGNSELFKTQAILIFYGSGSVNADIYACNKCGHVEMFVPQKTIDEHNAQVEESIKQEQEKKEREQEIQVIQARLEELKLIIQDDNQTVKAVNEAKREYEEKSKRLKALLEWTPNGRFSRMRIGDIRSKGDS